jgi:hypothetical protein
MAISINDDIMILEVDGTVLATARRRSDDWWEVSHWPRFFDPRPSDHALAVTELLETGHYDAAFTMRTYVHASDEDLKQGTKTLAKIHKIA